LSDIPENLIAPFYMKGGLRIQTNIVGLYRLCEESGCGKYIACPFVRCQKHRTDFAIEESVVPEWSDNN